MLPFLIILSSHIMGDFLYKPATPPLGRHFARTKDFGNGLYGLNASYILQISHKHSKHADVLLYLGHIAPLYIL